MKRSKEMGFRGFLEIFFVTDITSSVLFFVGNEKVNFIPFKAFAKRDSKTNMNAFAELKLKAKINICECFTSFWKQMSQLFICLSQQALEAKCVTVSMAQSFRYQNYNNVHRG